MTRFTSTDPATEATNWEGEAASAAQVQAAVDAARTAFPAWADAPRADRIDAVKRYQAVLKDRAPQIAEAIARETGKPLWETKTEAAAMIGKVDISIRAYDERTGERTSDTTFAARPCGTVHTAWRRCLGRSTSPAICRTAISSRPCWRATRSSSSRRRKRPWSVR
jgi:acyl-CoA reductase-like NAD-dependent aldehyde dehydrogenase